VNPAEYHAEVRQIEGAFRVSGFLARELWNEAWTRAAERGHDPASVEPVEAARGLLRERSKAKQDERRGKERYRREPSAMAQPSIESAVVLAEEALDEADRDKRIRAAARTIATELRRILRWRGRGWKNERIAKRLGWSLAKLMRRKPEAYRLVKASVGDVATSATIKPAMAIEEPGIGRPCESQKRECG
jgi:hypothetical protein